MAQPTAPASNDIKLQLSEHNVGFIIPPGGRMEGRISLPCGALINGEFVGDLICEKGSIIVQKGAKVQGRLEAERIYIEGDIVSGPESRSLLIARALLVSSSNATIHADMYAAGFSMRAANVDGKLSTLAELDLALLERRSHPAVVKRLATMADDAAAAKALERPAAA